MLTYLKTALSSLRELNNICDKSRSLPLFFYAYNWWHQLSELVMFECYHSVRSIRYANSEQLVQLYDHLHIRSCKLSWTAFAYAISCISRHCPFNISSVFLCYGHVNFFQHFTNITIQHKSFCDNGHIYIVGWKKKN